MHVNRNSNLRDFRQTLIKKKKEEEKEKLIFSKEYTDIDKKINNKAIAKRLRKQEKRKNA